MFTKTVVTLAAAVPLTLLWAQSHSDPVIAAARQLAVAYSSSLPDYIVQRTTTRALGRRVSLEGPPGDQWLPQDSIAADVAAVHGVETYANIKLNGKPARAIPAVGAWSAGEFSNELLSVFAPSRATTFTKPHTETLRAHDLVRYNFAVTQKNSEWHLSAGHLPGAPTVVNYITAYYGAVWIDVQTGQVFRVQKAARDLPHYFPLEILTSNTDYDFVTIGGKPYLLPLHSETITCQRNTLICLKNETVFHNYDKFVSGASISFDGPAQ